MNTGLDETERFLLRKLSKWGLAGATVLASAVMGLGATSNAHAASGPSGDNPSFLIVGGQDATVLRGEVSIQANGRHRCTGSLITRQWVLTAAHCTVLDDPAAQVRAGSLDWAAGGELRGISRVERHPRFNLEHVAFDQALVKLDRPVRARPIPMAISPGGAGTITRLSGWGWTCQDDGPECQVPSQKLQELRTVVAPSLCDWGIASDGTPGYDPKAATCIVSADGKPKQACHGDSGGPLQRRLGSQWYLVATMVGDGDSMAIHPNYCSTSPSGGQGSAVAANTGPSFRWIFSTLFEYDPWAARELTATTSQ